METQKVKKIAVWFEEEVAKPDVNAVIAWLWSQQWFVMIIQFIDFIWGMALARFVIWLLVLGFVVGRTRNWAIGKFDAFIQPQWLSDVFVGIVLILGLIVLSAIAKKVFGKSDKNFKRAVACLVIVGMFVAISDWADSRHFNHDGTPTRWVNTNTGEINKKPNNRTRGGITVDSKSFKKHYIDGKTGDTCVLASHENVKWVSDRITDRYNKSVGAPLVAKTTVVFSESYSYSDAKRNGRIYTDLKGYSLKPGDRLIVKNVGKKAKVVKILLDDSKNLWGYADNIDGEFSIDITHPCTTTANEPIILSIDGRKGVARLILERTEMVPS